MSQLIRDLPPACLFKAIFKLLMGRLKLAEEYKGIEIKMEDGSVFKIFRNITLSSLTDDPKNCLFIVSFKFSRLSHKANRIVSVLPMLLIAGFPGFVQKMYAVNPENGYWQGMYQWKTAGHLARYKKSFVYKMMNKRAVPESVNSFELPGQHLREFVNKHLQGR